MLADAPAIGRPAAPVDEEILQQHEAIAPIPQAGDILIHHINGRGWHTAEALPRLLAGLRDRGYRFVLLKDFLIDRRSRTPDRGSVR